MPTSPRTLDHAEADRSAILLSHCRFKNDYGYNGRIDRLYMREIAPRMKSGEHYVRPTAGNAG